MMKIKKNHPKYLLCALTTQASRHLISYYDSAMKPFGITAHQMMALTVLSHEDNISLGLFAQRAEVGKAAAVGMIKRLETMGLVKVKANPDDARLNLILLSKKGRSLIPEIFKSIKKLENTFEKAMGLPKLRELVAALKVIRDLKID